MTTVWYPVTRAIRAQTHVTMTSPVGPLNGAADRKTDKHVTKIHDWCHACNQPVFGLGVFGMARRHALVSLRHAAPSQRHAAPYFFFLIFFLRITIIILKRDDKPVKFYDIGWLLYQRIINTFRSLPYPCSTMSYSRAYIIFTLSHTIFMFKSLQ